MVGSTPSHLSNLGFGGYQGHLEENGGRRDEEIQTSFDFTPEVYIHKQIQWHFVQNRQ